MDLAPGVRLGPYEIVAPIGAGGMGEVYRARDTRLDRSVAIKVLPSSVASDPQLRERFDREARAISSLNHPNICTLHDIGRDGGIDFLVLEFLDGQTLADRLTTGPLPAADAIRIALQVATALAAAHRIGVVHRDLKPANIMLTKTGAKLLDFGLAKAAAPVVAVSGLSMMPTTPPGITAHGTILGTFQYMAPEQIEGLDADARSDVFAFGAVLFEMLTGRTAFVGKTRASLLGAILKDEPPRVSSLQPLSPAAIDGVVQTCLAKDPDDRYQTGLDLLRELRRASAKSAQADDNPAPASLATARNLAMLAGIMAVMLAIGYGVARSRTSPAPSGDVVQFAIPPPPNETFGAPPGGGTGLTPQMALSPDGRMLVFSAYGANGLQLWLRSMPTLEAHPIPGTINGAFPFWSPDSRYVAFFANGKLLKVNVAGGPPITLCDALSGRGGTWNRDNVIVFSPSTVGPLQRVAATGGIPQPASVLDASYGDTAHRFPSFLPDGKHFLFSATIGTCCPAAKVGQIRLGALDSTAATTLATADSSATFASDYVLFDRENTLMAAPFDSRSLTLAGEPFPVAEQVGSEGSRYGSFSASANGTIVYARGMARPAGRLTWMDRSGRSLGTLGEPAGYVSLALSSDEKRVAAAIAASDNTRSVWILDVASGTPARFTFGPNGTNAPVWSNDDSRIVYQSLGAGTAGLMVKRADGGTHEQALLDPNGAVVAFTATDWSKDGRLLMFNRSAAGKGSDIWALPLVGDAKPYPVVETTAAELNGTLSPNGKWLAYQSNESGRSEVYVQPFPPTGGKFLVSREGGYLPMWRPDGKELFFLSQDNHMMAAPVNGEGGLVASAPTSLFPLTTLVAQGAIGRQYAPTHDGRFLVNAYQQQLTQNPLTVILNWPATIQR